GTIGIGAGIVDGGPGTGRIEIVLRPYRYAHAHRYGARGQDAREALVGERRIGADDVVRLAVGGNRRVRPGRRCPVVQGIGEQSLLRAAPVAHLRADADVLGVLVFGADDEMGTVPEVTAVSEREVSVAAVVVRGLAVVGLEFEPAQLLVENDVHHTGHRVGPVDGGGAAGDHFSPGHQHRGDQGDVHAAAGGLRHDTLGVDQGQGACSEEGVQAAQVRELCAHVEVAKAHV